MAAWPSLQIRQLSSVRLSRGFRCDTRRTDEMETRGRDGSSLFFSSVITPSQSNMKARDILGTVDMAHEGIFHLIEIDNSRIGSCSAGQTQAMAHFVLAMSAWTHDNRPSISPILALAAGSHLAQRPLTRVCSAPPPSTCRPMVPGTGWDHRS